MFRKLSKKHLIGIIAVTVPLVIAVILLSAFVLTSFVSAFRTDSNKLEPVTSYPLAEAPVPTTTGLTRIDDNWDLYTNIELGFSMKIPHKEFPAEGCPSLPSRPWLKVIEGDGFIVLTESYGKLIDSTAKCDWTEININNYKKYAEQTNWDIYSQEVNNEAELNNFINKYYGPRCEFGTWDELPLQKGSFKVEIEHEYGSRGFSDCDTSSNQLVFYSPTKKRAVTWTAGQAVSFAYSKGTGGWDDMEAFDQLMWESFRFTE